MPNVIGSSQPSIPKNPFGNTNSGIIGNLNKKLGFSPPSPQPSVNSGNMSMNPAIGTNPGVLKSTKDSSGNTTTYHAPTPNPSVLEQQKMLNKNYGAGLVEDGIIGDKTRGAIAKYLSSGSTSPTVKSDTTTTPPEKTIPTPTPDTPQVGDTKSNYQNVLNTGNLTPLEQQSRDALTQAGQMTPQESKANEDVANANAELKAYQNVQSLSPYAEASMYGDRARTPAEIQALEQAPDLAGRASATNGLLGSLGNIYGSANVAGANAALQGIQTAAGRGLSAAGTNLGAAQTQAGRAQGAAGTVASASNLYPTAQGQAPFSALGGYQGGSDQFGNATDPASGVNVQSYKDLYNTYNQGKVGINQAIANEPNILNTISQFGLNNQPLSGITNLNEFLSGHTSQPGQQQLSTDVANYIKALGIDTATLSSSIANQQSGTLIQLLNNLKQIAVKNNEAVKTTADSLKNNGSSSTGSGGGLYSW